MTPNLLPCPFCGGEAESRLFDAQYFVQCIQCFNSTAADHDLEESAVSAWNTRAKSAPAEPSREAVEVVAYLNTASSEVVKYGPTLMDWDDEQEPVEPLMTVAQHNRIVADLTANRDALLNVMRARKMLPKCEPSPDAELVELLEAGRLAIIREIDKWSNAARAGLPVNVRKESELVARIDAKLASLKGVEE